MGVLTLEKIKAMFGKFKGKAIGVAKNTKKVGQDDPRRIIHSIKVGLALTFVSFFYYFKPLYDGFGTSAIWAVLTVVVVFEFTVGATLSKSMNRGIATLLAGALGAGAAHLASLIGGKGEPIVLGVSVFILASIMSFIRFFPRIKAKYDYGMLIFILTFSMVTVSGYRVDQIITFAHQRLSTILIGGASCMVISIFIFPVWAGEDLQNLIATNLENLATFLEGFGVEFCGTDTSYLQGYKSVLTTKNSEESLANFAWWEPRHGNFGFRHPYELYLKIGVLIRKCGYNVEILSNYLNTGLQIPTQLQNKIQQPCMAMSSESSKVLRELAYSLKTMTQPSSPCMYLETSKSALKDLTNALQIASSSVNTNLLEIVPALTLVTILTDIVGCVDDIYGAVTELSRKAQFKEKIERVPVTGITPQLIRRGAVTPVLDLNEDSIVITIHEIPLESSEKDETLPPVASLRLEV